MNCCQSRVVPEPTYYHTKKISKDLVSFSETDYTFINSGVPFIQTGGSVNAISGSYIKEAIIYGKFIGQSVYIDTLFAEKGIFLKASMVPEGRFHESRLNLDFKEAELEKLKSSSAWEELDCKKSFQAQGWRMLSGGDFRAEDCLNVGTVKTEGMMTLIHSAAETVRALGAITVKKSKVIALQSGTSVSLEEVKALIVRSEGELDMVNSTAALVEFVARGSIQGGEVGEVIAHENKLTGSSTLYLTSAKVDRVVFKGPQGILYLDADSEVKEIINGEAVPIQI